MLSSRNVRAAMCGVMNSGIAPERMVASARFGAEHVQRGAGDLALFQHLDQIFLDQVIAAADVDQVRVWQQLRQSIAVENTHGIRRQRQHVHQEAGASQERRQGLLASVGLHAGQILGVRDQPATG